MRCPFETRYLKPKQISPLVHLDDGVREGTELSLIKIEKIERENKRKMKKTMSVLHSLERERSRVSWFRAVAKRAIPWAALLLVSSFLLTAQSVRNISACVEEGGDGTLTNSCNKAITVEYCVDNDSNAYACSGHSWASVDIRPGGSHRIPDFDSAPGPIKWAACTRPQSPYRWSPSRNTYSCQG